MITLSNEIYLTIIFQLTIIFIVNAFFNTYVRNKQYLFFCIFSVIIYTIAYTQINVLSTGILWLSMTIFSVHYSNYFLRATFLSTMTILIYISSDYLVTYTFGILQIMPSSITRLAISALTYLILALILKRFITNRIIQNRNNLEVITFTSVMTFLIYFIIISVERFVATEHAMEKTNFLFITFYGIASTIIAASVIFIMNKNYKAKNREIELKQLISYSKKIEINYNELRKFKHDYMNILLSLEGFIQDNNLHSLKEYFYSTIKTSNNIFDKNLLNLSQLSNLEILELKGLITGKLMDAMQNKVQITVEIPEQINSFPIPSLDLVRVIGIILDNAIEATVNTNNSFIRFAIIPIKNSQLVIVSNSCTNSTPPLHKIKKNGYSTKGDNRGIGLSNLDDLIAKYPIVSLDTKIENNCFTQKICIKNGGQHA